MSDADAIRQEIADLCIDETRIGASLAKLRRRKAKLRSELVAMKAEPREVSDHAVLRYLERAKGIDILGIRSEMRAMADAAIPAKDRETHWHPETGLVFIIGESGQVITVLSPEQSEKYAGRKLANGERIPMSKGAE
jgi:hypothetical protein